MTGLMMPSILPTTTSGLSLWAAAPLTASASAITLNPSSARSARMALDGRQLAGDRLDLRPQALEGRLVRRLFGDRADNLRDALHVDFGHAAGGYGRRSKPNAAGYRRAARLARHGRHAGDDAGGFQRACQDFARVLAVEQLDDQQMVISAPGDHFQPASNQAVGEGASVVDHLLLVAAEV